MEKDPCNIINHIRDFRAGSVRIMENLKKKKKSPESPRGKRDEKELLLADQRWLTDGSLKILNEVPLDQIIDYLLSYLLKRADADRAYMFRINFESQTMRNTNELVKPGISPEIENLQCVDIDDLEYFIGDLQKDHIHHISSLDCIPPEAWEGREILAAQGITSLIFAPVLIKGKLDGFIGLDWNKESHCCSATEKHLMRSAAYLISLAMEKNMIKKQLLKSRERAEESDRLKTLFLSDITRELEKPINAIVGFSKIIAQTEKEEFQSYVKQIEDNREELMAMIHSIMEFSQIEAHSGEISLSRVSVLPLMDEIHKSMEKRIPDSVKLLTRIHCSPDVSVMTDRGVVRQIVNHLVNEAVKELVKGEIRLKCHLKTENNMILFSVLQVEKNPSERDMPFIDYDRSGLDLTLCKSLAAKLGGELSIERDRNKGLSLSLILPLNQAKESA